MLRFRMQLRSPRPHELLTIALVGVFVAWFWYESRWAVRGAIETAARKSSLAASLTKAVVAPSEDIEHLKLYLPKALYTFPGKELRICFENLVAPQLVNKLAFKVKCPVGSTSRRCWSGTFTAEQVGVHPWEIIVSDLAGKELACGTCEVRVPPLVSGEGKQLRLLIVGDSLTHATWYPNRLSELFKNSGNPRLEMIGTHKTSLAAPGVAHEGYNGWTWTRFVIFDSPGMFLSGTPDKSPFLYANNAGESQLDVPRYLREASPDGLPDLVIFQLGINDVFNGPESDRYLFAPSADTITPYIDRLLEEFRNAAPRASLAIWLTQPVNATQASFDASYKGLVSLDGIQRSKMALRQHWIADHLINRYGGREAERLYLIPMSATVDPLEDYDENNSVHPSVTGYYRIAESVYAWTKWWLADTSGPAAELADAPAVEPAVAAAPAATEPEQPPAAAPAATKPAVEVAKVPAAPSAETPNEVDDAPLKLYLPKVLYAYPGMELRVPFENIVTPTQAERLRFTVNCAGGSTGRRYWSARFTPEQVGTHPLELVVSNLEGKELLRGKSEVRVAPLDAGAGRSLRMLIVGDSVTHATLYPNRVDELFALPNNPRLTMIGTNHYSLARPGVVHEGYNGWTWQHFLRHYDPGKPVFGTPDKSPFLFVGKDQTPKLDIARYLRETSPDGPPDLVMFELGINDVFQQFRTPNPNDTYIQDEDSILRNAQKLVQAFRDAAPQAALAVWLTQPINASQDAYTYAYRTIDDFRRVKRSTVALRQHQFAARLADCFGGREQERIYVIPMSATIDPVEDYPADNVVHPSAEGYVRIGDSIYAWMKWWLANQAESAAPPPAAPAGQPNVAEAKALPTR